MEFSEFCIFTIKKKRDLDVAFTDGRKGKFSEKKVWRTGEKLLISAKKNGLILPIIFCDAGDIWYLVYWAKIDDIIINDEDKSITYKFSSLTKIEGDYNKTDLRLKEDGRQLSQDYIRNYALCYVPDEILNATN